MIRKGPTFDKVVLTPREQAPRIFYTRDGKQIFIIYMDGSTNTGVGVMTLRVEILTIESGKRKSLFKIVIRSWRDDYPGRQGLRSA